MRTIPHVLRPASGCGRLREQPLDHPAAVGLPRVPEPVVQAVFPSFPEFDGLWCQAIPAPVRGERDLKALISGVDLPVPGVELLARARDRALARGPRAYARLAGPRSAEHTSELQSR